MSITTDINILRSAGRLENPKVSSYLGKHPEVAVLIGEETQVFHAASAEKVPLFELRRFLWNNKIMKSGQNFIPVLDTVFESYMNERERSGQTEDPTSGIARATDLLELAVTSEASDIHVEARREGAIILFRVHGVMRTMAEDIDFEEAQRLIQTYYVNSQYGNTNFDPMSPCDGQFNFIDPNSEKDYIARLNCVPTAQRGLKMVARLRNPMEVQDIAEAGYSQAQMRMIRDTLGCTEGMLLFCGPTNSGKSTSVTSLIASLPRSRCVVELADPIEAYLPNCTHVSLNSSGENSEDLAGLLIEATVRQDTDILVLGEIRSPQTASAAEKLAEQGKLVISTLHTGTVLGVYSRLTGLGMTKHLLSLPGFFRAAAAQRLIPTLCPDCCRDEPPLSQREANIRLRGLLMMRNAEKLSSIRYHNPEGCEKCQLTGIISRTLVAEVMVVDDSVRAMFASGDLHELRKYLVSEQGMESMHRHALDKVLEGILDPFHVEARIEPFSAYNIELPLRALESVK